MHSLAQIYKMMIQRVKRISFLLFLAVLLCISGRVQAFTATDFFVGTKVAATASRKQSLSRTFLSRNTCALRAEATFGGQNAYDKDDNDDAFSSSLPYNLTLSDIDPLLATALEAVSDAVASGGRWRLSNDFSIFINQCTLQSFLFLLKNLRDPQTVLWLEHFAEPTVAGKKKSNSAPTSTSTTASTSALESSSNENSSASSNDSQTSRSNTAYSWLLNYHGLAAMNTTKFPTWESFFEQLLQQPTESWIVESSSKYAPDYEMEINPARLCARILSLRVQIANEFARDLTVVANMGHNLLAKYWQTIRQQQQQQQQSKGTGDSSDDMDRVDGQGGKVIKVERESLLFMDYDLSSSDDFAPSPLRKGNFDLLVLLATQEAIHRVLNDEARQKGAEAVSNAYLRSFYASRLVSHFIGSQRYNRADDFLLELLSTPPSLQQQRSDDMNLKVEDGYSKGETVTSFIDPTRLAELIVDARREVALEWQEYAKSVPESHTNIQRLQLNILMGLTPVESDHQSAASNQGGVSSNMDDSNN